MRTFLRLSLARKTRVRTSLHSKEIISTNPRPKSVYDFGLVYVLFHCLLCDCLVPGPTYTLFHTPMARFVLKVPLNTTQLTKFWTVSFDGLLSLLAFLAKILLLLLLYQAHSVLTAGTGNKGWRSFLCVTGDQEAAVQYTRNISRLGSFIPRRVSMMQLN